MARKVSYLTTAEFARLNFACLPINEAFPHRTFLVGSVTETRDFRDVDIRVVLDDDKFDELFKGKPFIWSLFCLGITELLCKSTGLSVDFQIQRMSEANKLFEGKTRNPIGTRARLFAGGGDATNLNKLCEEELENG